MRCSKCGSENPGGKKFCGDCGAALANLCPKCGADNPADKRFCGECGTALASPAAASAMKSDSAPVRAVEIPSPESPEAERKTVTALFADLKGSTELEQDLDPEEARAIVDPALKLMIDAVQRYDGYVVQSTGDGIFAIFGAPVAHEDHPQRAIYAALRIQEELRRYSTKLVGDGGNPLEARVGASTGEVVVRSIATGSGHAEYTPIGHTANLASRMQAVAPTGSIAISDETRRLVEGYFALKARGPTRVRGIAEPVNVYEVTGLGPLRTRLQRSAGRGLTKFVGREREMEAMRNAAELAKSGRGQIVAAVAEAGTGKSRLFFEFKAKNQSGWMVLEAYSVSHGKASAYFPVIELLHSYFDIKPEDEARKRREKVTGRLLALDRSLEDTLPYLLALLGIVEGDDPLAGMEAEIRRRRTLDGIKRILLRESLNQPLMVVFEDLHWIDAETQALLNLLGDSIANAKILLLVNYRPEHSHSWGSKTYYTQLRLDPLGKESAEEMLSALLSDSIELAALKRLVIERTEGNPFFMEEMVQAMFEDGALYRNGAVRLARPLEALKVPPTVQGVLASRIDRLPPEEKELLQTLAVIGREFPLSLVRAIAKGSSDGIDRAMNNLQLAEFIYEQPAAGDLEYIFKHALTQQVAHDSLLLERRKNLHERVAEAIATLYEDHIDEHLSELANHYRQSRNVEKAVEFLGRAAGQAANRSAMPEAEALLHDAINLLATLPTSPDRDLLELGLQTTLGALLIGKSVGAPEREAPLRRAYELCGRVTDSRAVLSALFQIFQQYIQQLRLSEARVVAERAAGLSVTIEDPVLESGAWHNLGEAHFWPGDLLPARAQFERALALYEGIPTRVMIASFGSDWWVVTALLLSVVDSILGRPEDAIKWGMRIEERARNSSHQLSRVWGFVMRAWPELVAGADYEQIRAYIAPSRQLAEEYGFAEALGWAQQFDAYARFWLGERGAGRDQMIAAGEGLDAVGSLIMSTWRRAALAEMHIELGDYAAAEATISEGFDILIRTNEKWCEAELYRVAGDLDRRRPDGDLRAAEKQYRRAIEIARKQSARWWELRASKSLARLLRDTNRRDEARAMLSEIYGWFTEGFDTADLKDAKALLVELKT
jgi:class 3 adenylate cyclase/tetratricopeptide (TPR) repeat protein